MGGDNLLINIIRSSMIATVFVLTIWGYITLLTVAFWQTLTWTAIVLLTVGIGWALLETLKREQDGEQQ